ncbi:MAG: cyclase family protein [Anaerolineae bacterium]
MSWGRDVGVHMVDLTHPLTADMPHWPGDPPTAFDICATISRQGFYLRRLCIGEHTGTHIGVAAHIHEGGMTLEHMPPERLICPAVMLDWRGRAGADPDALLALSDLAEWEQEHGLVPAGSVFLLCTGWSRFWPDAERYLGQDAAGILHFPGFSSEAVRFLVEARGVQGLGIDTAGIDGGASQALEANRILLGNGRFHLENLANLERLPPKGAWLFIGALPLVGAGGSPARVLAWCPDAV